MVRNFPDNKFAVLPVLLAVILHALVFGGLFVAFDWSRPSPISMPLAITATIVTESAVVIPPVVEKPPEPVVEALIEPEPVVEPLVEPEPIEPDPAEQARLQAEEQKRLDDEKIEQQRLQRIEQEKADAERKRQAEEQAALEKKRKAEEEAELERKRVQAEQQRQRDIERQREQNRLDEERLQQQQQQAEISAEAERLEAMNSSEMRAYQAAIQQKVLRNWVRPATAPDDLECFVAIRQLTNGEVVSVQVQKCNGDDVVVRSIEVAVRKASPLPLPSNPILFLRDFQFRFTIRD